MKPNPEILSRWDFAERIAREAGQATLRHFCQNDVQVDWKADNSPVTEADREAELLLRERVEDRFPNDGILGEEFGVKEGTSDFRWLFDPIDGTKSFVAGVPLYSTLVGIVRDKTPVIGVIEIPALDERVYACVGQGCWHRRGESPPQRATVSECASLAQARFVTTAVASFAECRGQAGAEAFALLQDATWITRTWGDGYGYLLVATGRAEVMVDPVMNPWDVGPLLPVLTEAGGSFTDWNGNPTIEAGEGIATNGHVLEQVLAITRGR